MAALELSALGRQCLRQRVPDLVTLDREIQAWVAVRNAAGIRVHWSFTAEDVHRAMPQVYPLPNPTDQRRQTTLTARVTVCDDAIVTPQALYS